VVDYKYTFSILPFGVEPLSTRIYNVVYYLTIYIRDRKGDRLLFLLKAINVIMLWGHPLVAAWQGRVVL